jgi:hypothetical protein
MFKEERYRQDFQSLLDTCKDRGIAVQTIKSLSRGPWAREPHTARTWYEPFEDQVDIDLAVSWVLGQGYIFLNTAGDIHILPKVLEAAGKHVEKPREETMEELVRAKKMSRLFVS